LAVPSYLETLDPDLVIFHYTFLAQRVEPEEFEKLVERIKFIKTLHCRKALVPHDEQLNSELLCSLCRDFGVTHIFTPASPPEWPQIYEGLNFGKVIFHTVLTGYIDDATVRRIEKRSRQLHDRPIDVGYRSWDAHPWLGRHGLLKREIGLAFKESSPKYGLVADISSDYRDAFLGDSWFDFLLQCKYTIGVEGGSSLLDRDGSITKRTRAYLNTHDKPAFEEVEAAVFPNSDGNFNYRLLGPRHLEAVMTRTCQVLIEGNYGDVLEPGKHYIELKRDFSNLDEVLEIMREDTLRAEIVERAYQDVIASGRWTYHSFVGVVFGEALAEIEGGSVKRQVGRLLIARLWNYFDDNHHVRLWNHVAHQQWRKFWRILCRGLLWILWQNTCLILRALTRRSQRRYAVEALVYLFGEERARWIIVHTRNLMRRARDKPPIGLDHAQTIFQVANAREGPIHWREIKSGLSPLDEIINSESFNETLRQWWDVVNLTSNKYWLTGSAGPEVWDYLNITDRVVPEAIVLNIGIGLGYCTRELARRGCIVDVLDISKVAINSVHDVIDRGWQPGQLTSEFPEKKFDLAISNLVTQHMLCEDLKCQINAVIRSLKPTGVFAMQFAFPLNGRIPTNNQERSNAKGGSVWYTLEMIQEMVDRARGRISWSKIILTFPQFGAGWYAVHITKT
jgi:SAM-dependent methyltransferase